MKYGYARVSTSEQDLTIQLEALEKAGCDVIRQEKESGSSMQGRNELATLLEFMREGDTLVVTRIDRLARSMRDLTNIIHDLKQRGIHLSATEQPIDTSTTAGVAFFGMLSVFSQFETSIRRDRQLEGIQKAKERGVYKRRIRKPSVDAVTVRQMHVEGVRPVDIARQLGVGRTSVYRALQL